MPQKLSKWYLIQLYNDQNKVLFDTFYHFIWLVSLNAYLLSLLASQLPSQLQRSFSTWKGSKLESQNSPSASHQPHTSLDVCQKSADRQASSPCSVSFPRMSHESWRIRAVKQTHRQGKPITKSQMRKHSKHKSQSCDWLCAGSGNDLNIFSLHTPVQIYLLLRFLSHLYKLHQFCSACRNASVLYTIVLCRLLYVDQFGLV